MVAVMTHNADELAEIPDASEFQDNLCLIMVSVLFIAGSLIWILFYCLKLPVKRFARYCSDLFLIELG